MLETLKPPAMGHNKGPSDTGERLARDYAELLRAVDALAERANAAPFEILDETALNAVSDLAKEVTDAARRVEDARVAEKEPHLNAGRSIDAFFKESTARLDRIKSAMSARATTFLKKKAEAERQRRIEEERQAREEADAKLRAAAEAEAAQLPVAAEAHLEDALASETRAVEASQMASAKSADLARTRSDKGTLSTLQKRWEFEIQNYDAIPLEKLRPYLARVDVEKAVRQMVRFGGRELAGVRIFETEIATIR